MQLRLIALGHRSAERGVGLPSGVLSAVLGVGGAHRVVHRLERREHEHVARAFAHVELAQATAQVGRWPRRERNKVDVGGEHVVRGAPAERGIPQHIVREAVERCAVAFILDNRERDSLRCGRILATVAKDAQALCHSSVIVVHEQRDGDVAVPCGEQPMQRCPPLLRHDRQQADVGGWVPQEAAAAAAVAVTAAAAAAATATAAGASPALRAAGPINTPPAAHAEERGHKQPRHCCLAAKGNSVRSLSPLTR